MKHWLLRLVPLVLIGLVAGPVIGMLLAEQFSGSSDPFVAKEGGFVGFIYGLRVGPIVGLVLGVAWALRPSGKSVEDLGE